MENVECDNTAKILLHKATKLQKQNTVQLLPFDEDNTYLYQLDESYIDRERRPRSIFFHRAIKTCIDRYMSYLFYYNIILFKSCDLQIHYTIHILNCQIDCIPFQLQFLFTSTTL
jgi:hypothetical protein